MTWTHDASHFPHRVTAALADVYCRPAEVGLRRGLARYGVAQGGWQVRADDGIVEFRAVPLAVAEVAGREAAAVETFESRRWLADAADWRVERARASAVLEGLVGIDVGRLSDGALAHHLLQARSIAAQGVADHFELHLADMLPLGRLLVAARRRGIDLDEVLAATAGLSPASRTPFDIAPAALVGRLDVDAPSVADLPHLGGAGSGPPDIEARSPWDDEELASLFADVAATFWVRDDNATRLLSGPVAVLGAALREAAARLPVDALAATAGEAASLLTGRGGPDADELARRAAVRARPVPLDRGGAADEESDAGGAPVRPGPRSAELAAALDAYDVLYERSDLPHGIGAAVVRGEAVVATTPDTVVDRLGPGTVLVTRTTSPAVDPALLVVDALVCEEGGPLCHAAVAARELGISAIIGLPGAMAVPDGTIVEVDPRARRLSVVDDPARPR